MEMGKFKKAFLVGSALFFHWISGYAVNTQSAASVASGWVDLDNSTLFFADPTALCPGGNLQYESDYEVRCSNRWRVYGIYSFACPVGYLPNGYQRSGFSSLIQGPYGVGPDGLVVLAIGPGGPTACFREIPDSQKITLRASQQTLPSGLAGSTDIPLIATLTREDGPVAGIPISFSINTVANSGSHEHHDSSRPAGSLNAVNGITDANGEIKISFRAPDVSGIHTITASCGTCVNPSASADIQVKVPDLLPISPNPPRNPDGSYAYALTSVDQTHAGNGRYHHQQYYLTDFSRKNLRTLINAFSGQGWGTVALNDASLSWGGRYDIRADWKAPHAGHRDGREIDISFTRAQNPVSTGKQKAFYKKFCEERAAQVPFSILHHYALNPHFHVYLEKQTSCWTTEK